MAWFKGTCSPENPIFHGKNHGFLFNKVVKPLFLVKIVPTKPIHRVQSGTGSGSWQCDMVGNVVRWSVGHPTMGLPLCCAALSCSFWKIARKFWNGGVSKGWQQLEWKLQVLEFVCAICWQKMLNWCTVLLWGGQWRRMWRRMCVEGLQWIYEDVSISAVLFDRFGATSTPETIDFPWIFPWNVGRSGTYLQGIVRWITLRRVEARRQPCWFSGNLFGGLYYVILPKSTFDWELAWIIIIMPNRSQSNFAKAFEPTRTGVMTGFPSNSHLLKSCKSLGVVVCFFFASWKVL